MAIVTQIEFKQRRQSFLQKMQKNSIAVIPGASEWIRNGNDSYFSYRQNSNFYYLTGFNEPDAVMLLVPEHPKGEYWLFNLPRDPQKEIWHGRRAGQEGAENIYQADCAYAIEALENHLLDLLQGREVLYFSLGRQSFWDKRICEYIQQLRTKGRLSKAPEMLINPEVLLNEMRLHKSTSEIASLQKACDASVAGHLNAMRYCRPGQYEYDLQAIITQAFMHQGCLFQAYPSIIGAGENSCILHYNENNSKIQSQDIILIDAGAEFENYAADVTRSFPATGRFNPEQRAIYEIVLRAQVTAIEKLRPGLSWPMIQETVCQVITEGLVDIGLLKGKVEDLIAQKAYTAFYMHGASHWLGLDVHDVGDYSAQGVDRKLASGMVLTIEPGIYIAKNTPGVDERWWNIGIRIEDDVLITEEDPDVLTKKLPKKIDDIEAVMQG